MNKLAFDITRFALAITFIWIGFLIFRSPLAWGSLIQPWALNLLPVPLMEIMLGTAVLDTSIGILFLFRKSSWLAGLMGALHIISVLIACGINDITVRDIGLFGASLGVMLSSLPAYLKRLIGRGSDVSV